MNKATCTVLCLCLTAACAGAQTADWPSWRGPNGDGTTPDAAWNPLAFKGGARIAWTFDLGFGYSSVSVLAGRVYAVGRTQQPPSRLSVWCLDAATGAVVWQTLFDVEGYPHSSPVVDGERLYALTTTGTLVCLRMSDGRLVWQSAMHDYGALMPGYKWSTTPAVDGNVLLLAANSRALGIEKTTGTLLWSVDDPRQVSNGNPDADSVSSCAVGMAGGRHVAYFVLASTICAVDPGTGGVLWEYSYPPGTNHDPIVMGDTVYFTDGQMLMEAGPAATPQVLWKSPIRFGSFPAPVPVNRDLYGTAWPDDFFPISWTAFNRGNYPFVCVDAATGAVVWSRDGPWENVLAANGKIISMELTGTIHVYDVSRKGLTELSSADVYGGRSTPRTFACAPVLVGGFLYCRNFTGDLLCVDMR
jgi:outer membrane protein assembly factor BamB